MTHLLKDLCALILFLGIAFNATFVDKATISVGIISFENRIAFLILIRFQDVYYGLELRR